MLRSLELTRISEFGHGVRRLVVAGVLMAHVRTNRLEAALSIAKKATRFQDDDTLAPGNNAGFILETALATVYLASGIPIHAMPHVRRIREDAEDSQEPEWIYRAHALEASVLAQSGDFEAADAALERMRVEGTVLRRSSDSAGIAEFVALTAEFQVAFTRQDVARMDELILHIENIVNADAMLSSLSLLAKATRAILLGNSHEGLAYLAKILSGAERQFALRLVLQFALHLQALVHIGRGEYELALREIEGESSSETHFACVGYLRATAHIRGQQYVEALQATNACMRIRSRHSLWTLGPVLLRRAIANLKLGNPTQALLDGVDALHLIHPNDTALIFMSLLEHDIVQLFEFLANEDITCVPLINRLQENREPSTAQSFQFLDTRLPKLTKREIEIANQLSTARTLTQISTHLGVATGTVKSQAHGIYKKLGVGKRSEAVAELGRRGFYSQPK
ncbi:helix-turn-helix transcriptional regulator [Leucobacter denitrificans]|nr:helix-turn-helix transcriptional regulator [Leucobacter denitrificans]